MKIKVRWKMAGQLIEDGIAHSRKRGDEDLVTKARAVTMQQCGMVEIVGTEDDVPVVTADPAMCFAVAWEYDAWGS